MPLTDEQRRTDLLELGPGEGNPTHHTGQVTSLLEPLRTEHTAAQSGPSGVQFGRLWTVERTGADLVHVSAGKTAALWPPPEKSAWSVVLQAEAPQGSGGCSVVLTGPVGLLGKAVTVEQLTRLAVTVAAAAAPNGQLQPVPRTPAMRLPVDAQRRRYWPGQRSARAAASGRAFTWLPGAAAQEGWHLLNLVSEAHQHGLDMRSGRATAAHRQRRSCRQPLMLAERWDPRRAYRYLIAVDVTIATMDIDRSAAAAPTRVGVIMRLPPLLRSGLERRAAGASAASMNGYLESLVVRDLAAPAGRAFEVFVETTCNARGTRGGRPAKGPRSVILLRVDSALRESIHQRAAALGLRLNVYLESLVSQDISAAAPAREETTLDQTA